MKATQGYINQEKDRYLEELFDLLRLKSISADPDYKDEVLKTAAAVKERLNEAGVENLELFETSGYPVVYGDKIINPDLPTILVYGHYDVQPAEPLNLWHSPAFEPEIRDGKIYARGACDDKGQMYMHVKAVEAMIKNDELPCNVKFMIEGEEEIGSGGLSGFVKENAALLKADIILVSDTSIIANDTPSITVGLRGLSYMEVEVTGPDHDLHSGVYGGAVGNPINILTKIISELIDENGHIKIDGFYDDVENLSAEDRVQLNKRPLDLEDYKKRLGVDAVHGEKDYTTVERTSIRPTLDVNGIWGGYMGEGAKTVLPSQAFAKISMRLVPSQDWEKISQLFETHFRKLAPDYVKVKVTAHHGGQPLVVPSDSVGYKSAESAMEKTFGKRPIPVRSGGSIPIISLFKDVLEIDSILMGFGLDTDLIHSPNEHFGLWNFYKGIETIPYFYENFAKLHHNS
ncbi:MAG: acetylornithine deacetylase/succinyl-diaminopimelate desuccinylase-like protein [Patiriisocius sp.]|jgi:acetylornithine deacetylase/succinyl-diaminopimelate desuccinylase-like protein